LVQNLKAVQDTSSIDHIEEHFRAFRKDIKEKKYCSKIKLVRSSHYNAYKTDTIKFLEAGDSKIVFSPALSQYEKINFDTLLQR
jgi:hypothetical protein